MKGRIFLLIFLISAAGGVPARGDGEKPETLAQRRQDAQRQVADQMRGLTSLGEQDMEEVLSFSIQGTKIVATTSMPATGPDFDAVKVRHLSGQSRVRVQYGDGRTGVASDRRRFIQMEYFDMQAPGTVLVHDQLLSDPDLLNISEDLDYNDGSARSVQLVQSAAEGPEAIKLYVEDFPPNDQGKMGKYELSAPSFTAMCWEHPGEANEYLRPIFRRLGEEAALFAVGPRAAWQVMADDRPVDPATAAATDAVMKDLGAESFSQRERAAAELRKLGEKAAIYLMKQRPGNLSLEQEMRVDLFLVPYRPLSADQVTRLGRDPTFLIDCLYNNDAALKKLIVRRLEKITGREIDFDAVSKSNDAAVASLIDRVVGSSTRGEGQ